MVTFNQVDPNQNFALFIIISNDEVLDTNINFMSKSPWEETIWPEEEVVPPPRVTYPPPPDDTSQVKENNPTFADQNSTYIDELLTMIIRANLQLLPCPNRSI